MSTTNRVFINRQIRVSSVLCIDSDGTNLGNISLYDALKKAQERELDLVQVNNSSTPTCKIMDHGKFKYEQAKKEREARKKMREASVEIKEIKFRPSTDVHDLFTKAKHASEFLLNGDKLRVTIMFKGRQMSHQEVALETLNKFMSKLPEGAKMMDHPLLNGRNMTVNIEMTTQKETKKAS